MAGENIKFNDINATTAAFTLRGGRYQMTLAGSDVNSTGLETLAGDGSTWLAVAAAMTAAGVANHDLAPGQYRFALASASGVYVTLSSIPL